MTGSRGAPWLIVFENTQFQAINSLQRQKQKVICAFNGLTLKSLINVKSIVEKSLTQMTKNELGWSGKLVTYLSSGTHFIFSMCSISNKWFSKCHTCCADFTSCVCSTFYLKVSLNCPKWRSATLLLGCIHSADEFEVYNICWCKVLVILNM